MKQKFLQILACPACKSNLLNKDDKLVCQACQRTFEIKEGIPILLL